MIATVVMAVGFFDDTLVANAEQPLGLIGNILSEFDESIANGPDRR